MSAPQTAPITWNGRPVRAVIFDMDGVIADTREAHREAWLRFAEIEGFDIDPDEFIRQTFGRGNMENMAHFYPARIDDKPFIAEKSDLKEGLFLDLFRQGKVAPLAGLRAFLEELRRRGAALAVGSSAPRNNIDTVLEQFDIRSFFEAIVAMEDVEKAKPDPSIFLQCCEALGAAPEDALVLEDSLHGLEAGRRAGCRVIGVTTMHPETELAPLCDATIPDFEQVWEILN